MALPDPTFMILGAQKCATSWLAAVIGQHPDVFIPAAKELHFFNKRANYAKGIAWYRQQFDAYAGEQAVGEATPNYFWTTSDEPEEDFQNIPERVHQHYPDLKFILILRDPVARAISAYYHHIGRRLIAPGRSFSAVRDRLGILSMGYYAVHLKHWLRYFPRDRFLILLYEEDVVQQKEAAVRRVFRFLGVDEAFVPPNLQAYVNVKRGHTYLWLHYFFPDLVRRLRRRVPLLQEINVPEIKVSAAEKKALAEHFEAHNRELERLLGRPLPW